MKPAALSSSLSHRAECYVARTNMLSRRQFESIVQPRSWKNVIPVLYKKEKRKRKRRKKKKIPVRSNHVKNTITSLYDLVCVCAAVRSVPTPTNKTKGNNKRNKSKCSHAKKTILVYKILCVAVRSVPSTNKMKRKEMKNI